MTQAGAGEFARSDHPRAAPRRRHVTAVAVLAIGLAAAGAANWLGVVRSGDLSIAVVDHASGQVVYERPAEIGERFVLEHTHSVTRRPIVETFSVAAPDTIALEELWFDEFGPNLPAGPEQLGDHVTFIHEDGAFRVLHHGYPIGTVPLRVGSAEVDHVLTFSDHERVRLLDIVPAGMWVDFVVRPE